MGCADRVRTRRYHSLLTVATTPPSGRVAMLKDVEAWIETPAGRVDLSTHRYPEGVFHPNGRDHIARFQNRPPTWTFETPAGTITQECRLARGAGGVSLEFRGELQGQLFVRPLLAGVDHHALCQESDDGVFVSEREIACVKFSAPRCAWTIEAITDGEFEPAPVWYRAFCYEEDRLRGDGGTEDLHSPGIFRFAFPRHAVLRFRATEAGEAGDALLHFRHIGRVLEQRERASESHDVSADYLVERGSGRSIIAGYPWFTDWGRDTFIAMRGICDLKDARRVLSSWSGHVSEGMLPNRFAERGDQPEYHSVDAALWFVVVVGELLDRHGPHLPPGERAAWLRAVEAIVEGTRNGTRHGIRVDDDGLLAAGIPAPPGSPGLALTWMDARIGEVPVTPRVGKPVEIQALWYNALDVAQRHAGLDLSALSARVRASFKARFLRPDGALYDVVDTDHVPGTTDASIRPNQAFAVGGLPLALLDGDEARAVMNEVEQHLLTPAGLRSLSPADPSYRGVYRGDVVARDLAYHQGTVWPWLMGAFVEGWLRVHGRGDKQVAMARSRFLEPLEHQLGGVARGRGLGLGHLAELADGDAPHEPKGAPFQAWSMGELRRIQRLLGVKTRGSL